jgi:antitoxin component of MazEF toxin-antitoxin module
MIHSQMANRGGNCCVKCNRMYATITGECVYCAGIRSIHCLNATCNNKWFIRKSGYCAQCDSDISSYEASSLDSNDNEFINDSELDYESDNELEQEIDPDEPIITRSKKRKRDLEELDYESDNELEQEIDPDEPIITRSKKRKRDLEKFEKQKKKKKNIIIDDDQCHDDGNDNVNIDNNVDIDNDNDTGNDSYSDDDEYANDDTESSIDECDSDTRDDGNVGNIVINIYNVFVINTSDTIVLSSDTDTDSDNVVVID